MWKLRGKQFWKKKKFHSKKEEIVSKKKNERYLSDEFADTKRAVDAQLDRTPLIADDGFDVGFDPEEIIEASAQGTKPHQGGLYQGGYSGVPGCSYVSGGNSNRKTKPVCKHPPRLVIDHAGLQMSFGKKYDCETEVNDFDIAVNLTGTSLRRKHDMVFESLKKWESFNGPCTEILIDWPDYGVIPFPLDFWEDLAQAGRENGGKMVVFCFGGHGRTGTAMACFLISELEYTATEAIAWVRKNYCEEAIESNSQMEYIRAIGRQKERKVKKRFQLLDRKKK